jgi:hypothetical protein
VVSVLQCIDQCIAVLVQIILLNDSLFLFHSGPSHSSDPVYSTVNNLTCLVVCMSCYFWNYLLFLLTLLLCMYVCMYVCICMYEMWELVQIKVGSGWAYW